MWFVVRRWEVVREKKGRQVKPLTEKSEVTIGIRAGRALELEPGGELSRGVGAEDREIDGRACGAGNKTLVAMGA
jgi:hypothetical protein